MYIVSNKLKMCWAMMLVTMNIPHLLLKAFCDKVLNVGKVCTHGFFFPRIYQGMCCIDWIPKISSVIML